MIWTVFITTASLCLLLLPGFLFNKLKITQGRALAKGVSDYILYVAQPAMLIAPYIRDFDVEILKNAGFTVPLSFICHGLFTVSAMLIIRRKRKILPEDSENAQSEIAKIKNLGTVSASLTYFDAALVADPTEQQL